MTDDAAHNPYAVFGDVAPPTAVRWRVVGLLMLTAVMCHFNRIGMAVAGEERIMSQYKINETSMGMVYTTYLLAYTAMMIPGGWLIDRRGPHAALALMGGGAAVLVAATGAVGMVGLVGANFLGALLAIRALLGVVSAPMHPGAAQTVSYWLPAQVHSLGNGLITGSAVFGIGSTYFVLGRLMDWLDWPAAFLLCGGATAVLTGVWIWLVADRPRQHAGVNDAERRLIEGGTSPTAMEPGTPTADSAVSPDDERRDGRRPDDERPIDKRPNGERLDDEKPHAAFPLRSLILLTVSFAAVGYFEYLFFYWMQYYFDKVVHLGKYQSRLYTTIPTLAMAVGMIAGGWLADWAQTRFGRRLGRAIVPVCGMTTSAVLLGAGLACREPEWIVAFFSGAMAAAGASEVSFWVTAIDLGGRRGGTAAAILNTGGNAGGALAPVVTPLVANYAGWPVAVALASVFCLLGAVLWRWIEQQPISAETVP
jgi:MFS family permease